LSICWTKVSIVSAPLYSDNKNGTPGNPEVPLLEPTGFSQQNSCHDKNSERRHDSELFEKLTTDIVVGFYVIEIPARVMPALP
jgi:hypothetical protein